jgi:hypothetical protein
MNNVEFALVILLSIGFLILIVLSIILVSLMLAIMKNLKRISQRAEAATENVAGMAETLSRNLAPLAASGILGVLVKRFTGKRKSKGN